MQALMSILLRTNLHEFQNVNHGGGGGVGRGGGEEPTATH